MDCYFNKRSTDILYAPPKNTKYKWGKRRLIAWPVFAYKVVASEPKPRQLNILQITVLKLTGIGFCSSGKISEYIGIHSDLIEKVFEELKCLALIDEMNYITQRGKKRLTEEDTLETDLVSGYIFQDVFTGEFWNRFIKDISQYVGDKVIEEKNNKQTGKENINVKLKIGERKENLTFIFPDKNIQPKCLPSADDIRCITKTHKKLMAKLKHSSFNDEQFEKIANLYKNARILSQEPDNIFFLTAWVYFPKESEDTTGQWNVYDPFGLENDIEFKKRIIKVYEENRSLNNFIKRFVGDAVEDVSENLSDILSQMHKDIAKELETQFSKNIYKYESLFESLVKLKIDYNSIAAQKEKSKKGLLNSYANNLHLVLEVLLTITADEFSTYNSYKRVGLVNNDPKGNENALKFFLKKFLQDKRYIARYSKTPFSQIRHSCNFNEGRICARLLANMFVASANPDHPLFKVAKNSSDIFYKFRDIEDLRNSSQHGGENKGRDDAKNQTIDTYLGYADFAFQLIAKLLLGIENNKITRNNDAEWQEKINLANMLISTDSDLAVKDDFGNDISIYENAYSELLKIYTAYSIYEKSNYNNYEMDKVAQQFTKIFEAIFEIINEHFPVTDFSVLNLSFDKNKNEEKYNHIASKLNFKISEKLPESTTRIKLNKIKNQSTLNGKVLYSLLASSLNKAHPLIEFAGRFPELFDFLDEIQQKIRQKKAHHNTAQDIFTPEYISEVYKKVIEMNKCLFKISTKRK